MLNSIPIDIVEIIIVKTFDYGVFQKLQEFLTKLKEPSRISRINDKLTVIIRSFNIFQYKVNNAFHREYDKPDYIYISRHTWALYNSEHRIDKPSCCWIDGSRRWRNINTMHNYNNYPCDISYSGTQEWNDNDRKPNRVYYNGFRANTDTAFNYL